MGRLPRHICLAIIVPVVLLSCGTGEPESIDRGGTPSTTAQTHEDNGDLKVPDPATSTTDQRSGPGVAGTVVVGPQCPVGGTDEDCSPAPVEADVVVRRSAGPAGPKGPPAGQGEVVARTRSGRDGSFRAAVPAGHYVIEASTSSAMSCKPVAVTVHPDRFATVTVQCDSGVR